MSLTWRDEEDTRQILSNVRALTDKPFYANFVLHFKPTHFGVALDAGIPIITFSWGNPAGLVKDARSAGTKVGIQVTSAESAKRMLELEPDFLIAQGVEAGGHVQSVNPLTQVLTDVVSVAGDVPVFAAGGLATGADLARMMHIGAAGGVFGTRFVASTESDAHPWYRSALVEASPLDTVLTTCFNGEWPNAAHRVLQNSTYLAWEAAGCPSPGNRPGEDEPTGFTAEGIPVPRYDNAMPRFDMTGNHEAMALYAGTSIGKLGSVIPAANIVQLIWNQACAILPEIAVTE